MGSFKLEDLSAGRQDMLDGKSLRGVIAFQLQVAQVSQLFCRLCM